LMVAGQQKKPDFTEEVNHGIPNSF